MPPRYAYWTILIDGKPTAFRARDKEELQPTLFQLKRRNADVVMKWFARGRLWDTPEQAQWAAKSLERSREKRGRDWRPGGQHRDPRDRSEARSTNRRALESKAPAAPSGGRSAQTGRKPWEEKRSPTERRQHRPWQAKRAHRGNSSPRLPKRDDHEK